MRIAAARRTQKRASHMRTSITRPQQHLSPTSRLKTFSSETLCLSDLQLRPSQNGRHVLSRTSRQTITPGPSTRSRIHRIPKHHDTFANFNRLRTQVRLQGLTDLVTIVHQHRKSALAPRRPCLTHPHRRSATHCHIPLQPRAHCHPGTTRIARRMARSQ